MYLYLIIYKYFLVLVESRLVNNFSSYEDKFRSIVLKVKHYSVPVTRLHPYRVAI